MDIIFEAIFEFIFELIMMCICNKKISLWIRIPILIIFISFYCLIFGLLIFVGIDLIVTKETVLGGIFIIGLSLLLIVLFIYQFYKKLRKE